MRGHSRAILLLIYFIFSLCILKLKAVAPNSGAPAINGRLAAAFRKAHVTFNDRSLNYGPNSGWLFSFYGSKSARKFFGKRAPPQYVGRQSRQNILEFSVSREA